MAKSFQLSYPYTPVWKKNRERPAAEQFTVTLKDLQERQRAVERESISQRVQAATKDENGELLKDDLKLVASVTKANLDIEQDIVRRHLVSIENLTIATEKGDVEIKTFDELWEHASDVVAELSKRILSGPDAEELKN